MVKQTIHTLVKWEYCAIIKTGHVSINDIDCLVHTWETHLIGNEVKDYEIYVGLRFSKIRYTWVGFCKMCHDEFLNTCFWKMKASFKTKFKN